MPQGNFQKQQQTQSTNYQNAQAGPRTINGIAQQMDPMGGDANPFELIDHKNGNHYTQQVPTNQQGMPQGTPQFQPPNALMGEQGALDDGSASPMAKWFKKPDNIVQGQAPQVDPNNPVTTDAPAEFQSVFAKAKMEEFQALVGKRDYVGQLFTEDLATSFKEGDFSGLPALINAAVQQGASMTAFASSRLSDQAVNGMFANFKDSVLPQLLNDHATSTMWQDKGMEDFNSESMQPMVQMVSNQVRSMFPNATPQQLQAKTLEMLKDYSQAMGGMNFNQGANQTVQQPVVDDLSDMERLFNQSN